MIGNLKLVIGNQQPRPKGTRYVGFGKEFVSGFNTLDFALKGGVLNPSQRQ